VESIHEWFENELAEATEDEDNLVELPDIQIED